MFENMMDVFTGRAPLVMRNATVSAERVVGCDVIRKDHLGRNVVVIPKGQGVPSDIPLTERELSLVRPAPKLERVMRSSGHGFYYADEEVARTLRTTLGKSSARPSRSTRRSVPGCSAW